MEGRETNLCSWLCWRAACKRWLAPSPSPQTRNNLWASLSPSWFGHLSLEKASLCPVHISLQESGSGKQKQKKNQQPWGEHDVCRRWMKFDFTSGSTGKTWLCFRIIGRTDRYQEKESCCTNDWANGDVFDQTTAVWMHLTAPQILLQHWSLVLRWGQCLFSLQEMEGRVRSSTAQHRSGRRSLWNRGEMECWHLSKRENKHVFVLYFLYLWLSGKFLYNIFMCETFPYRCF